MFKRVERVKDRVSLCTCGHSFLLCVNVCTCEKGLELFENLNVWTEFEII